MLPALLATLAAGYLARRAGRWWQERASAARLPIGADGIVLGAHTIDLHGSETRAALMLHGFGDTPQTLSYLAEHLHLAGWSVRAPLLPGHGRTIRAFARSSADDWVDMALDEYAILRERYDSVALIGLSMGGALATIVAASAAARSFRPAIMCETPAPAERPAPMIRISR